MREAVVWTSVLMSSCETSMARKCKCIKNFLKKRSKIKKFTNISYIDKFSLF